MEFAYICGMNFSSYLRNRALRRALEQFLAEKPTAKMPNLQRVTSILIILDEGDKSIVKNIESSAKSLFGASRCGFVILCNQMSETILQSDLYTEITPKDFGFMSVRQKTPKSATIFAPCRSRISGFVSTRAKTNQSTT